MEEDQKEEIFQSPPEYQSRLNRSGSNSSAKKYITIIIFVVVIVVIILGIFKFLESGKSSKTDATPTPTEMAIPSDTPTPTEEMSGTPTPSADASPTTKPSSSSSIDKTTGLDRSKLAVHVENGSGTAGVSKKGSDFLTGLGYNVVEANNADNFDYTNVVIQIKSSDSKYLPLLKNDLGTSYTIGSTSATLSESGRDDAVVIIGQ